MGQEILYCHTCGNKLLSDDFTRGRAHTLNNRQYCQGCVPAILGEAPPAPAPASPSSERLKRVRTARVPVGHPRPAPRPERSSGAKAVLWIGMAVLAGALSLPLFLMKSGSDDSEPKAAVHAPPPVPAVAKPDPGKAAREQAKRAAELEELEAKAKPILEREQFGAALDLYDEARKRHPEPEWDRAVQQKIDDVRTRHAALYRSVKEKATGAQLRGASAEVQALRARVVGWGVKEWVDDLDKAVAAILPREPLPAG